MSKARRAEILNRLASVPPIPPAAIQALQLLGDPNVELGRLLHVFEHDPGLTANVLRLANSAAYAGQTSINTMRDALIRVGRDNVRKLVASAGLRESAWREIRGYDLDPGQLLEKSMLVARVTQQLANGLKIALPPHAFTGALLIDIGKVVLGEFLAVDPGRLYGLARYENVPFEEAERMVLGIDHAEVGAALLYLWKIPTEIIDVVRLHHAPESFAGDRTVLRLVHVADHFVLDCGIGLGLEGLFARPSSEAVEALAVPPAVTDGIHRTMLAELRGVRDLLTASPTATARPQMDDIDAARFAPRGTVSTVRR